MWVFRGAIMDHIADAENHVRQIERSAAKTKLGKRRRMTDHEAMRRLGTQRLAEEQAARDLACTDPDWFPLNAYYATQEPDPGVRLVYLRRLFAGITREASAALSTTDRFFSVGDLGSLNGFRWIGRVAAVSRDGRRFRVHRDGPGAGGYYVRNVAPRA